MSIVTLTDAKAQLNIASTDTSEDIELQGYIDAATTAVETQLGAVVDQRTCVDQIDLPGASTSFLLRSVPVISLTSLTSLDGSQSWTVTAPTMHVDGPSGCVTVLSGPPVLGSVLATYKAGVAAVPANIRLAALIIIQHLWDSENWSAGRGFAIPRRAIELLGPQLPGVA